MSQVSNTDDYIVYEVLLDGRPVYIGSGKPDRYLHAKSGKSHNPELNKLFFTQPDKLLVQIVRQGLSKEESLESEKDFIQALQPVLNIVHTRRNKKVGKYWK